MKASPRIVCVFAKPPHAGVAKTRLASVLGAQGAARLAEALLRDTWASLQRLDWVRPVLATTEKSWVGDVVPECREPWLQGEGDLGQRLERIARRALRQSPRVLLIGTDSPTLPSDYLSLADDALHDAPAVLGPCEDGGFYLLGLGSCPEGLLSNLPWSCATTAAATHQRLKEWQLTPRTLPVWYDVDEAPDLKRLALDLRKYGAHRAPNTARVLAECLASSTLRLNETAPQT